MEPYLPIIREIISDLISKKKIDLLDDKVLKLFFKSVYQSASLALSLFMSEEKFIDYCIKNKHELLPTTKQKAKKTTSQKVTTEKISVKKVSTKSIPIKKANSKPKSKKT